MTRPAPLRNAPLRTAPLRTAPLRTGLLCAGLVCLALLAACGRKGDLRPPLGEHTAYSWPKQYPAPDTVVPPLSKEAEVNSGLEPRSGFKQPETLPRWNGSRTTTTVYGSQ
ncbi:hypothetical protein SAMN06265365_101419 [Tistlia consotensis]|uniref:Lipoprotein-attachment site-containing protein n=1 Tax=Tistlia consotensis USBA 355 TaxID=560819 RepID=A0A1Y6B9F9_9PROT|nr:lipoprotein [Tistlia consotensis]SME91587.1 hypothetical protein SAMN05428998_101417 [Tistlia consotensis USBA 355]SNR27469.1 hypothetical protein SAMN06265365_101419 [Tistlia consotensis]